MNHQNGSNTAGTGFTKTNYFQNGSSTRPQRNQARNHNSTGQTRFNAKPFTKSNGSNNTYNSQRPVQPRNNNASYDSKFTGRRPQQQQQRKPQNNYNNVTPKANPTNVKSGNNSTATREVTKVSNVGANSTSFESKFMGCLVADPAKLGFLKLQHKPRPTPKYLLKEQVLFDSSSYVANEWDKQNQLMLQNREQQFVGDAQVLFEEFQTHREKERQMMESLNLVDKENAKKSLNDAIIFRGSCDDMCPTYERVERVYKNQVSKWEKDPQTGKISRNYALKTFMRPSGQAPPLPSDVRPPKVLLSTLNYIIEFLLPKLPESQSFIWDRTRSIRQDFTFQNNYSGFESIECHEKICRIHILSLHVMSGADDPDYQQQQEVEQLSNSLKTLVNMYDDVRMRGGSCPNEPEFRAYELVIKLKDLELERSIQSLPSYIINDSIVQRTLMLRGLINHGIGGWNLYTEFFNSILDASRTPFLLACLAEIHFNEIRYNALKELSRLYHSKSKKFPLLASVCTQLGFDSLDSLLKTCKIYGIPLTKDEENISRLNLSTFKSAFKPSQKQAYTVQIDNMIGGRSMQQIVNSGIPNVKLQLSIPLPDVEIARRSFKEASENTAIIDRIFSNAKFTSLSGIKNNANLLTEESMDNNNNIANITSNQARFRLEPQESNSVSSFESKRPSTNFQQNIGGNTKVSDLGSAKFGASTNFSGNESASNVSGNFNSNTLPNSNATSAFKDAGLPVSGSTLFGSNNTFTSNNQPSTNIFDKKPKESTFQPAPIFFGTKEDLQKVEKVENLQQVSKEAAPATIAQNITPLERETPKENIVNKEDFENAVSKEVTTLINDVVTGKMKEIIQSQIKIEQEKRNAIKEFRIKEEHDKLVNRLTLELYDAFVEEQIYLNILEGKARALADKFLKLRVVKLLRAGNQKLIGKRKVKESKIKEINEFNNSIIVPWKSASCNNTTMTNTSDIYEEGLNSSFLSLSHSMIGDAVTEAAIKLDIEENLNISLVLRDQCSSTSEWVCQHLNFLTPSQEESSVISKSGNKLTFKRLPENFEAKKHFKNINGVIVQVGSLPSDDNSLLIENLKRDGLVISKLIGYLEKYSEHKNFGIVVVYVDNFRIGLSYSDVIYYLGLRKHTINGISIGYIDMTKMNTNIKIGGKVSVLNKMSLLFDQIIERTLKKVIEADKNSENKKSGLEVTDSIASNSVIKEDGKSLIDLMINPMNAKVIENYKRKRGKQLNDIMDATKVKVRKRRAFSHFNSTLDLSQASKIETTHLENELHELDALANSILEE